MKNGSFYEELVGENDFEAVLTNFCCYDYGVNASDVVQKISRRTLTQTADFIAPPIKKTYLGVYYLLTVDTNQVLFFSWHK